MTIDPLNNDNPADGPEVFDHIDNIGRMLIDRCNESPRPLMDEPVMVIRLIVERHGENGRS